MLITRIISLGAGGTGLTLRGSLVELDGTIDSVYRDLATFLEIGGGFYLFETNADPDYRGALVVHTGDVGVAADFSAVTVKDAQAMGEDWTSEDRNQLFDGTIPDQVAAIVWAAASRTLSEAALTITPMMASVTNPRQASRDLAPMLAGSAPADLWTITDGTGAAVNLSGKSLRFVVYEIDDDGDDEDRFDDTLEAAWKYETGGAGITIGGGSSNQVTVQHTAANNVAGDWRYILWNTTDNLVLAHGKMPVLPAVKDV
jgi:hypothetical protein